ncbi:MAG: hypothetical protein R2789_11290 [Microthrixaceae bacterium]
MREGTLPGDLAVGDIVATPVTGAYGHSMGNNYNKVLRPPVVFVSEGEAREVVRRGPSPICWPPTWAESEPDRSDSHPLCREGRSGE